MEDIKTENLWFMQGDCLERMKEIPSGSVDMVLTDPPYGTTACKWDSIIPLEPMWKELNRLIKPDGAIILFAAQPFTSVLITSNIKRFKHEWVWDKVKPGAFAIAKYRPLRQQEDIIVFAGDTNKVNYYPIMTGQKERTGKVYSGSDSAPIKYNDGKERIYDKKYPKTIITFSNANQKEKLHPTQKPVALMEYLIKTYTNENETVLDFTAGSFTTGVACVNVNRNFIGIELDNNYFDIGVNRILKAQEV